ncbi:hypothetical protein PCL_02548 [Purpureocillium lilacinum]|uniref:Uncharacterized protein n=1 Tax=Purpureocillium lilacinum TaxID=33203 RepID=A0A2U3E0Y2_PURLI|nr:hypothetical protein PCL_02548 [Purpureocillium lilacinum]
MESREDTSNILDPWPTSADGTEWDGRGLLGLVQQGLDPFGNPFRGKLDTRALFVEIEQCLESTIVDIPLVSYGAHYFGFHVVLKSRPDVVVRVSRGDTCNRAYRESDTQQIQLLDSQFELDVYRTLVPLGTPFNRRPVHHRLPLVPTASSFSSGYGISGRGIFVFDKAEGEKYDYVRWRALNREQKSRLLRKAAKAAAKLFEFELPRDFCSTWVVRRGFGRGFHFPNTNLRASRQEEGAVVPALLSEPKMIVTADLVLNEHLEPSARRCGDGDTPEKMAEYTSWSREYYEALFARAPAYKRVLEAGRDARFLWTLLHHIDNVEMDRPRILELLATWAEGKHAELDQRGGGNS